MCVGCAHGDFRPAAKSPPSPLTCSRVLPQMKWECEKNDTWEPYLDWRNIAEETKRDSKEEWKDGFRMRRTDLQATFYAPFNLKIFPLDSHTLEVLLVTNDITDVTFTKLRDEVATLHPHAVRWHLRWHLRWHSFFTHHRLFENTAAEGEACPL
eukprot:7387339-Prymnesium_polylepis.3